MSREFKKEKKCKKLTNCAGEGDMVIQKGVVNSMDGLCKQRLRFKGYKNKKDCHVKKNQTVI